MNPNEQYESFADLQKQLFAPARAFGGMAAATLERLARHHYAVLGDYVDFAVRQVKLPAEAESVNELVSRQLEASRSFGEKLAERAREYLDIVRAEQGKAADLAAANDAAKRRNAKKAA